MFLQVELSSNSNTGIASHHESFVKAVVHKSLIQFSVHRGRLPEKTSIHTQHGIYQYTSYVPKVDREFPTDAVI